MKLTELEAFVRAKTESAPPVGVRVDQVAADGFVLTCSQCLPGKWAACRTCPDRPLASPKGTKP